MSISLLNGASQKVAGAAGSGGFPLRSRNDTRDLQCPLDWRIDPAENSSSLRPPEAAGRGDDLGIDHDQRHRDQSVGLGDLVAALGSC